MNCCCSDKVELRVQNTLPFDRKCVPVSNGIPIPKEMKITEDKSFCLYDNYGSVISAQFMPLAWWEDGISIKWLLVSFNASVMANDTGIYYLDLKSNIKNQGIKAAEIAAISEDNSVDVNTGKLMFSIGKKDAPFISEIYILHGGRWIEIDAGNDGFGPVVATEGVVLKPASPEKILIEYNGTEKSVIGIRGYYSDGQNVTQYKYVIRLEVYRNSTSIKIFNTLQNLKSSSTIDDLSFMLPAGSAEYSLGQFSQEGMSMQKIIKIADDSFCLLHDSESTYKVGSLADMGSMDEIPGQFAGWLTADTDKGWSVSFTVRHFWEKYPKSLQITESGSLKAGLLPGASRNRDSFPLCGYITDTYNLANGESRTHELLFHFHTPQDKNEIAAVIYEFLNPSYVLASWEWYTSSKALGDLIPRDGNRFPEFEKGVDDSFETLMKKREQHKEYGDRNYGDDLLNVHDGIWNNCEYDYTHIGMIQFLRGAGREWFDSYALPAARHIMDIDIATSGDHSGKIYQHQNGHNAMAAPKLGSHAWIRGLLEYYVFTGDMMAKEVIKNVGEVWCRQILSRGPDGGTERATTWPLISIMALYQTFPEKMYMDAAKYIVDYVISLNDPSDGHFRGSFIRDDHPAGSKWASFLMGSPVIESLNMYYQSTGDERAKDIIIRVAKRLSRVNWIDELGVWEYTTSNIPENERRHNMKTDRTISAAAGYAYLYSGDEDLWNKAVTAFTKSWGEHASDGKVITQSLNFGTRMLALVDMVEKKQNSR